MLYDLFTCKQSSDLKIKQSYLLLMEEELFIIPPNHYLSTCNETVNQGFGERYVSLEDLRLEDINQPIKKACQLHMAVALVNLITVLVLLNWFGVLAFLPQDMSSFEDIFFLYIGYLMCVYGLGGTARYLVNMKSFADYQAIFRNTHQNEGFFRFAIQCFDKKSTIFGRNLTFSRTQYYHLDQSIDSSGDSVRQLQSTSRTLLTFVEYSQNFRFLNDGTKYRVIRAFNQFAQANQRDIHQEYEFQFQIRSSNRYVCYSNADIKILVYAFHFFVMIGLAFPISVVIELFVKRYEIKIIKTLAKNS